MFFYIHDITGEITVERAPFAIFQPYLSLARNQLRLPLASFSIFSRCFEPISLLLSRNFYSESASVHTHRQARLLYCTRIRPSSTSLPSHISRLQCSSERVCDSGVHGGAGGRPHQPVGGAALAMRQAQWRDGVPLARRVVIAGSRTSYTDVLVTLPCRQRDANLSPPAKACGGMCAGLATCVCCVCVPAWSCHVSEVASPDISLILTPVSTHALNGASRAVRTHHGPTRIRLQATPSEGRQSWHYLTLLSPHLPPPALVLSDDCGPPGAVGGWAPPPLPPGPQDLPRD